MSLDENNRKTFTEYNIGDKLRIVDLSPYREGQVTYATVTGFDLNSVGEMILRLDEVGRKETRQLHPDNTMYTIEKL